MKVAVLATCDSSKSSIVSANQKPLQATQGEPIIPLFSAVFAVMAKCLYIQPMAEYIFITCPLSLSKIRALLNIVLLRAL